MNIENEAYKLGQEAYWKGVPDTDNPYGFGMNRGEEYARYKGWCDGWFDAQEEDIIEQQQG